MKTQEEMILEYMKAGNKISPLEALNKDGKTFAVYSLV